MGVFVSIKVIIDINTINAIKLTELTEAIVINAVINTVAVATINHIKVDCIAIEGLYKIIVITTLCMAIIHQHHMAITVLHIVIVDYLYMIIVHLPHFAIIHHMVISATNYSTVSTADLDLHLPAISSPKLFHVLPTNAYRHPTNY